jgi:dihydropteroate synthase
MRTWSAKSGIFCERLEKLNACGVAADQVVLDPVGIGFGKTLEHNLQLLAACGVLQSWRRPLLLGVSRKSFIGKLLGAEVAARLPASLACAPGGGSRRANHPDARRGGNGSGRADDGGDLLARR